ncbi:hypothetical protein ACHAPI_009421 [Fusarium lateritium]
MATAVQSDVVSYDTFEKLVASQNGGPLPDLQSFYKFVVAQPEGPADLASLAATTATQADTGNKTAALAAPDATASGFSQQTSANGSVINLWVYQRVYINALGKSCTINMGGITPGFPGGATLNGNLFATYQSGNVGWATGVAGGTGDWA